MSKSASIVQQKKETEGFIKNVKFFRRGFTSCIVRDKKFGTLYIGGRVIANEFKLDSVSFNDKNLESKLVEQIKILNKFPVNYFSNFSYNGSLVEEYGLDDNNYLYYIENKDSLNKNKLDWLLEDTKHVVGKFYLYCRKWYQKESFYETQ